VPARGPWWLPLLALLLCLGAGFFGNPFGPQNVLLQLTVPRSEVWRNVIEWGPLWDTQVPGVAFPVLFVVMAAIALAGQVHRVLRREALTPERVFGLLLVLFVIALAVIARRLVPWAAVVLVPSVALALDGFVPERRRTRLEPIPALGLIAFLIASNLWVARHYARNHPLFPNETLLERMVLFHTHFPGGAAQFLKDNHVRANAFSEWRWEGYLHQEVPDVKVMVGGRAHQVYDEATYTKYRQLLKGENPLSELRNLEVSLAIVPLTPEYGPFCRGLLRGEGPWAYVYSDRYTAIFADPNDPATKDLVAGASAGRLAYPDTATAVLSRALCLSSPSISPIMSNMPNLSVPLFREAVNRRPSGYAYMVLVSAALRSRVPREQLIIYLEQEDARLEALARGAPEEHAILGSRLFIADQLERLYPPEAKDKKERLTTLRNTVNERMIQIGRAYPRYFRMES
ncbi:MAG TPA: hypothetical protein VFP10_08155, partial [Candidatus Eisenbacteria bacterium]|nr:hypothetical protein [Candidatus Eisenbacteria bacterium]